MAPKKIQKKKIIANYYPDEEIDETAEKLQGMQEQMDARDSAYEKL